MAAADTARLVAELTLDDRKFSPAMARAERATGSLDKALSRAGKGLGTAASNLAKIGTIGGGLAVAGLAASVAEASNLNEQINKSAVVFGDASKAVLAFSETTADSLGLAQSEALEAAGGFGNMFKTTGIADKAAADMSTTMVTLAADMASFNNEDPTEMLDRLRSGLSGEAEPLRRFGVLLSEAAVQQEAYATGIAETGEKLTEAQKVQARYSLILKQTTLQQGDFERTSGSLANQQRILRASLKDTGATIGTALLPKITDIAVKINKLIKDNQPAIIAFANQLPAAFDRAVAFAERIPWATIGSGLEKAAHFAGELFDIFLNLPPEVQTTLIALAGLNKLSGGAVTGVVSELSKGLIKGVLGMTAGIVHLKAGTVIGGGGGLGGPAAAAGGIGAAAAGTIGIGAAVAGAIQLGAKEGIKELTGSQAAAQAQQAVGGGPTNILGPLDRLFRALGGDFRSDLEVVQDLERQQVDQQKVNNTKAGEAAALQVRTNDRLDSINESAAANALKVASQMPPIRSEMIGVRQAQAAGANKIAAEMPPIRSEMIRVREAQKAIPAIFARESASERSLIARAAQQHVAAQARTTHAAQQSAAAIRDKRFSVTNNITIPLRVTVSDQVKATLRYQQLHRTPS